MICISHLYYTNNSIIKRLKQYFSCYFETFSVPTAETLFLLVLSMLALESARSIRFLYKHFLNKVSTKSLNAFYYACSYAKVDYSRFMLITAKKALALIPKPLISQPLFLCVDDTMVPKFGLHFQHVSTLFDHAAHNGSNYLNGHCFVSLTLCVPVWRKERIHYLSIPLGYRMWQKGETSKLGLAADMVSYVMPVLAKIRNVILLCDSWYAKDTLLSLTDRHENLDVVCNARVDSVLYDLPPARTGKKGRPSKHGKRLSLTLDIERSAEKVGDYYIGCRKVLTNLFGDREVLAYATATEQGSNSLRLFFSTLFPHQLEIFCAWQEDELLSHTGSAWTMYIPLFLYRFRWSIEVGYYEQKSFWSLCSYMVRGGKGIEMLVNLINISYSAMKILPYADETFADGRSKSVQEFRFAISERIREQVFFASFVQSLETHNKSVTIITLLKQWVSRYSNRSHKL
jgi:hypothetical protein